MCVPKKVPRATLNLHSAGTSAGSSGKGSAVTMFFQSKTWMGALADGVIRIFFGLDPPSLNAQPVGVQMEEIKFILGSP
jgi:hypothetical protein